MNPSKQTLDAKLVELEAVSKVSEHDIQSAIQSLKPANSVENACQEWHCELLAFSFLESRTNKGTHWGTHFGPMMVFKSDDGKTVERPSLQEINKSIVVYWQRRAESTTNSLLRARYAGLVWELTKPAIGERPDHVFARLYCDALLDIANNKLHQYETDTIDKLARALSIAITLNDQTLIKRAKQTIIKYENEIAEDSKPGLWGFSFDLLVGNKKVSLSQDEEKELVDALESRLHRLTGGDPWRCEKAVERLARYYREENREDDCIKVIRELGNTFEKAAENATPLQAMAWLEHMHAVYSQFNLSVLPIQSKGRCRTYGGLDT